MGNPVVHWELWSADPSKLGDFYEKAFGWKLQNYPELNYLMADTDGPEGNKGINGGLFKPEGGPKDWPGNTALYIHVPDLAQALEKVVAAGGKVILDRKEVPGMGAFSLFADPEGRVLGLWWMPS